MKLACQITFGLLSAAAFSISYADCYTDSSECSADARERRDDCIRECDTDYRCRLECRNTHISDIKDCGETRRSCLADERAERRRLEPAERTHESDQPTYRLVSPPVYNPVTGVMVQGPIYTRVPSSGVPTNSGYNPAAQPTPCANVPYMLVQTPHGPVKKYPVPPNALCK
jgi:hypothetical protein